MGQGSCGRGRVQNVYDIVGGILYSLFWYYCCNNFMHDWKTCEQAVHTEWFAKNNKQQAGEHIRTLVHLRMRTTERPLNPLWEQKSHFVVNCRPQSCMCTGTVSLTLLLIAHGCSQRPAAPVGNMIPTGEELLVTRLISTKCRGIPIDIYIYTRHPPPPPLSTNACGRMSTINTTAADVRYTTVCTRYTNCLRNNRATNKAQATLPLVQLSCVIYARF